MFEVQLTSFALQQFLLSWWGWNSFCFMPT